MRRTKVAAAATAALLSTATALSLTTQAGAAPAASPQASPSADHARGQSDNRVPRWRAKYDQLRQDALEQRLRHGGRGAVERVGKHRYARVAQTGTDRIFVVLAQFGNTRHADFCDGTDAEDCKYPSDGSPQRYDGPLHNQIPKPDRSRDNSTLWQPNYSRSHYENMYFTRMKSFYRQQSSGIYSIGGDVTAWVKVPFNEARYGRDYCGDIVCSSTWYLIRDALAQWVQGRLDAGWSMDRITAYLKTFDHQDRYDFDGDGDFNEPDGYIDHFQIVHAGGDEADGDPVYGEDAIWSHRWNAQIEPYGTGPEGGAAIGGVNVGEGAEEPAEGGGTVTIPDNPTGVWVNDYTIQPENGGLSVFAHEFAHDLGLPDEYDTSGNTGGAENSTGFWTLMSQSRGTAPKDDGIGDQPMPFGAWDKFQLGWLDYDVARTGRGGTYRLRPGQSTSGWQPNGLIVLLPDKHVPLDLGAPCDTCGSRYYYSDKGNSIDTSMTREVAGGGALTAKVRYDIEEGYDFAYLEASSDGGETWDTINTSESDNSTESTDGISGSTGGDWVDLTATVPAGTNMLRWEYVTDPGVALQGFQVDNITLDGTTIGDAETDEGWEFDGFRTTTGTEDQSFLNAYFVDNRQYVKRDRLLEHLYNFGFKNPNRVEFFHYNPGALISYWDTSFDDNNVGDHPGGGQILPVDAHPVFRHTPDGSLVRPRTLTYDSTFSTHRSPAQTLHFNGVPYRLRGEPAQAVFNDNRDWWYAGDEHGSGDHPGHYEPEWYGVDVPKTGTTIKVVRINRKTGVMTVRVGSAG